jgi:hypothetical protein
MAGCLFVQTPHTLAFDFFAPIQGWAGFAFPVLPTALQTFRSLEFRPLAVTALTIDGNSAHSTGWWWDHAGAFYFGASLYYNGDTLEYNPGAAANLEESRTPCNVDTFKLGYCPEDDKAWIRMTNSKAFLVPGVGFNSWSGRMEVIGYETHDVGLAIESLNDGFWIDSMLAVCRTGTAIALPPGASAVNIKGNGFFWYDTGQEHIMTKATFRNCGYRSSEYNQYDSSASRGCGDDDATGCESGSTVFGFVSHSDTFNPEVMQGTKTVRFDSCGRRFKLDGLDTSISPGTVSGRLQNWLDVDGSASGLNVPTIIGSGLASAKDWWSVDDLGGF